MRLEALEARVGGGRGSASAGGGGVDAPGRGVEERSRCGGGGGWVEWFESMLLDVQSAQLYQQVSRTRRVSSNAESVVMPGVDGGERRCCGMWRLRRCVGVSSTASISSKAGNASNAWGGWRRARLRRCVGGLGW